MLSALQLLVNTYGTQTQGYRPDAQHLAIYITRNVGFTGGDPYEYANTMRRAGTWGLASLGFGVLQGGSSNNLIQLSGGERCYYGVGDTNFLNTDGLNFLQTLTCFDGHLCQG